MSTSDRSRNRLPPPAFPSGLEIVEEPLPEDAIISPDAPGEWRPRLHDALILPDEPVVRAEPVRTPDDFEQVMHRPREARGTDDETIRVTGIGASRPPVEDGAVLDPGIERLVTELQTLVNTLRRKGEAGLRSDPEMTRFEVTLRGYCTGYLAALRDRAVEPEPE
ncbi:MAG: hypothetical protein RQ745_04085 [Longimicrobiales bacterium]|nr:hypothetical protein [Longimicrobiales bacterium]